MTTTARTGVFLCQCGEKIDPLINLSALRDELRAQPDVTHCEILPYPCLEPGFQQILEHKASAGLNRLVTSLPCAET